MHDNGKEKASIQLVNCCSKGSFPSDIPKYGTSTSLKVIWRRNTNIFQILVVRLKALLAFEDQVLINIYYQELVETVCVTEI